MRPIIQTSLSDPNNAKKGNCVQACVASILELELNEVPNFIAITTPEQWELHFRNFFKSNGFSVIRVPDEYILDGYYLVVGETNRNPDILHMCIYFNGVLAHDPHPSQQGLTKIINTYLLVPYDPSKILKGAWDGHDW